MKNPTYEELAQRVKALGYKAFERRQTKEALRESEEKYRSMMEPMEYKLLIFTWYGGCAVITLESPVLEYGGMSYGEQN